MRPGQNKRMRGRPTNNRRGPNPLTRSYESNGPDVKIRGNAHHVAEKYLQLARDAHTSGDPVAAENYLQHAEHYYRLIASAQAAQLAAQNGRPPGEGDYDDDDDDEGSVLTDRFASPSERAQAMGFNGAQPQPPLPLPAQPIGQPQFAPQPVVNGPAPFAYADRQPFEAERPQPQPQQGERPNFQPRQGRDGRPERGPRPDRPFGDRQEGRRDFRPYRDQNQPRDASPPPPPPRELPPSAPEESPVGLPSFITARPRIIAPIEEMEQPSLPDLVVAPVAVAPLVEAPQPEPQPIEGEAPQPGPDGRFPRGRRRRLRSPYGFLAPGHGEEGEPPAPAPAADEPPASE